MICKKCRNIIREPVPTECPFCGLLLRERATGRLLDEMSETEELAEIEKEAARKADMERRRVWNSFGPSMDKVIESIDGLFGAYIKTLTQCTAQYRKITDFAFDILLRSSMSFSAASQCEDAVDQLILSSGKIKEKCKRLESIIKDCSGESLELNYNILRTCWLNFDICQNNLETILKGKVREAVGHRYSASSVNALYEQTRGVISQTNDVISKISYSYSQISRSVRGMGEYFDRNTFGTKLTEFLEEFSS